MATGIKSSPNWMRRGFIRRMAGCVNGPFGVKLIFADKLFPVLKEADQHHHC